MGTHWGITAYLITPESCAGALAAARDAGAAAPSAFTGERAATRWSAALSELEGNRRAAEPMRLSEDAQAALLAVLERHGRAASELTCSDAESAAFRGFLSNWLGWLADPSPRPAELLPGSFLGWRGAQDAPLGSIPPAMIQALPAARAQVLIERLRSPWGAQALALLTAIRAAARPGEHAVLMPWVDADEPLAAAAPAAAEPAESHHTQRISWLLHHAVASGASDLLITAGLPPQLVIDGRLEAISGPPVQPDRIRAIATPVLTAGHIATLERCGALRMSFGVFQVGRMRWTMCQQRGVEHIHCRLTPADPSRWSLDDSGYRQASAPRAGLVLVTGAAGTGRTTTAHAIIDAHNRSGPWRILTLEEPIEGVHGMHRALVTQHSLGEGEDIASLARALPAVLDARPDVVLIDQVDTRERLEAACLLVRAGALVVATVLGADAEGALSALHASVPAAVAQVRAVIESRWSAAAPGPRRLERTTLDGPALSGLCARVESAPQPTGR